jgi:hypothetical protein
MKSRERKVDVAKEAVNRWVQRCRHQSSTTKSDEGEEGDAGTCDDPSGRAARRNPCSVGPGRPRCIEWKKAEGGVAVHGEGKGAKERDFRLD